MCRTQLRSAAGLVTGDGGALGCGPAAGQLIHHICPTQTSVLI